jgi:hypothetical protein
MKLQYYMHDGPSAFRFELAGDLNNEGARRLQQDWRRASSMIGDRALIVDMTFVTSAENDGRSLLSRWYAEGAQLIAKSKVSRELAESIVGEPIPEHPMNALSAAASDGTWRPFRSSAVASVASLLLLLMALMFPVETNAATLKSETVTAWDDYLQTANANLQDRVRPGGSFLWTFEDAGRAVKVHGGEIVVVPAPGQNPKKVPGGLIHHWMGAMFVPHLKLDDILGVTRDYDHYKEFYRPSVVESKVIARSNADDKFSILLMNKGLFLKSALDADYKAANVRLDEHRLYSVTSTTRVQEVEEYGRPGQYREPEGEGRGYIWKLYSIARLEEREDGVYVELEAIALSRDIPGAMRILVDPIVRRVSRNSLLISLQQTGEAVGGRVDVAKSAGIPANAKQVDSTPASVSTKSSAFTRVH